MHTKLTLRLDKELIVSAKDFARQNGKSLSQVVADYFKMLGSDRRQDSVSPLPPTVSALKGSLRGSSVDEIDYRRYLEEKHL